MVQQPSSRKQRLSLPSRSETTPERCSYKFGFGGNLRRHGRADSHFVKRRGCPNRRNCRFSVIRRSQLPISGFFHRFLQRFTAWIREECCVSVGPSARRPHGGQLNGQAPSPTSRFPRIAVLHRGASRNCKQRGTAPNFLSELIR